jgi:hypothetical protein
MKKKWILRAIAVICIVVFLGYIYVYETTLHGLLNTTKVVLAKDNIPINTKITKDHLYMGDYPKKLVTAETVVDKNLIIGKRTVSVIGQHDTFSLSKVDDARIRMTEDHRFFSIPSRWIESLPGSLRRLDLVDIWLIPSGSTGSTLNIKGESNTTILDQNEVKEPRARGELPMDTPFLQQKVVAFIKNNQNTEVVGNQNPNNRLNAESNPSVIELSLTNEEFSLLLVAVQRGYKLVFSY